jgi:hypothetical protein
MSKYAGLVGYVTQEESVPGVWSQVEKTSTMKGDIIRQSSTNGNGARISDTGKINDDISLSHRVSLLGDAYAFNNYYAIKWIKIDGHKWQVTSVELQRPRIIITVGGLWNG